MTWHIQKFITTVAGKLGIALLAAALFAAMAVQNVLPTSNQRHFDVLQIAQIDESPSTIGIADSEIFLQGTLEQINARLDLMQSLGVTDVRILVPWAAVQPLHPDTPFGLGAPRWDQLDRVVNAAAARGMGILGVLNSTPLWATSSTPVNGQPTDVNRFADFAKSVALRYGDKISAYEVWNEPNSVQFWNPVSPEAYAEMLKVTYTALKEASVQTGSEITVIGGVVGAGTTWGNLTLNPVDFVQRMYDAGADGYFDALSFHPYNYDTKFSAGEGLPWSEGMPLYQLNKIRELMDSHQAAGEEQIKIWITEYGVPTNKVSEATQAAFIRDLIDFWQTAEGAGPIFVYTIQDRLDPAGTDDEAHLGVFRPDGTMKPAAEVLKELIEYYSDPSNPGPGPGPGPVTPSNPIAALLQALQQAVTSLFNLVPNIFNAISVMINSLVKGIFGGGAQPATTRMARTATAGLDDAATLDQDVAEPNVTPSAAGIPPREAADAVTATERDSAQQVPVATDPVESSAPATEPTSEPEVTEPVAEDGTSDSQVADTDTESTDTQEADDTLTTDTGEPDIGQAVTSDTEEQGTRESETRDRKSRFDQQGNTSTATKEEGTRSTVSAGASTSSGD